MLRIVDECVTAKEASMGSNLYLNKFVFSFAKIDETKGPLFFQFFGTVQFFTPNFSRDDIFLQTSCFLMFSARKSVFCVLSRMPLQPLKVDESFHKSCLFGLALFSTVPGLLEVVSVFFVCFLKKTVVENHQM